MNNNEELIETPQEQDGEYLEVAELSPGRQQLLEELRDARTLQEAVKAGK
jgi:hypothetical protein